MATVTLIVPTDMSLPTTSSVTGLGANTSEGRLEVEFANQSAVLLLGSISDAGVGNFQGTVSKAYIDSDDGQHGPNLEMTGLVFSFDTNYYNNVILQGNLLQLVSDLLAGSDTVVGSGHADTLLGFAGNDTLIGGGGGDEIDGGKGFDTVSYASSPAAVSINLGGQPGVGGDANGDQIFAVEQLIGSKFGDVLGGAGDSTIRGLAGNDFISGGNLENILDGGRGRDRLDGGDDRDIFDFNSVKDSVKGSNRDQILDFSHGQGEKIDLKTIDAQSGGGNQAFKFIGKQDFHDQKGELRYIDKGAKCIVQGDVNGDGKADFEIFVKVGALAKGDFLL